jgi:hypothetical protein
MVDELVHALLRKVHGIGRKYVIEFKARRDHLVLPLPLKGFPQRLNDLSLRRAFLKQQVFRAFRRDTVIFFHFRFPSTFFHYFVSMPFWRVDKDYIAIYFTVPFPAIVIAL